LPGILPSFSLSSAHGDQVFITTADAFGNPTGFRGGMNFGAAENGVSFGRYETSVGVDFPALSQLTFGTAVQAGDPTNQITVFRTGRGAANAYPKVGPVVINEIHYHPPDVGTNDNSVDEYIELLNIAGAPVTLFDAGFQTNTWRLRDAVDFDFPTNVTLPAGGFLLVVNFNPATDAAQSNAFRSKFSVPGNIPIFGPYGGKLNNDDDNIELYKPDVPQAPGTSDPGFVPFVLVDRVHYSDSAPWASAADGNTNGVGVSLQRVVASNYGNDPVNWIAGNPTAGAANGPALLTPPSISVQPLSRLVMPGTNVTFTVTATGSAALRYQWRFNGNVIARATNSSLTVTNVQLASAGKYTVLVNNTVGAAGSSPAILTVQAPPVITSQPLSRTVAAGATVTFSVGASGTAPLSFQWMKDGTNISGATNPSLTISNVQSANEGNYTVTVSNLISSATSQPANLSISAAPAIVTGPQGTNVFVGANVTLSVLASGSPPLRYQWRLNNSPIPNATNSTLTLTNVTTGNSGNYTVLVTNAVGGAIGGPATVNVTVPPSVTITATDANASEPGANTGAFRLSRSGNTSQPLTVNFTVSGSASNGVDYSLLTSPVTIPAGASLLAILVTPIDDVVLEGNETVVLSLAPGPDYIVSGSGSATVTIFDNDNQAPTVSLTDPPDGSFYTAPVNLPLTASAMDTDGTVAKIEFFYRGTNKIGEVIGSAGTFVWTNAVPGTNVLTAVATDNLGSTGVSAPVTIIINGLPTVSISSPANNATFATPANITINANANDADGSVTQVEFYEGANLIGVSTTPTANAARADYLFQNTLASSAGVAPPLQNLGANGFNTAIVDGTSRTVLNFAQNDGLSLSPTSGVVSSNVYSVVVLFSFNTISSFRRILDFKNASSDNGLYVFNGTLDFFPVASASGPPIGSNTFVQVAMTRDSFGNAACYVNGVQQIAFVDTNNHATLDANNVLRFFRDDGTEASAGSVARIRLFDFALSASQVAGLDRLPGSNQGANFYSIVWSNVTVGSYTLTAVATDNRGATMVSAPVTVNVVVPPPGFSDFFANRSLLTGFTNFITGSNAGATNEVGEPNHFATSPGGRRSVWLSWIAPASGTATMDTFGSAFDTVLAVYTNNPPGSPTVANLVRVTSNDDDSASGTLQSKVQFAAIAGVTYQIAVDGYSYAANNFGNISFHMNLPNPLPVITTQPASQTVNAGVNVTFSVVASGPAPISYQWRFNNVNLAGATSASYLVANAQSTNAGSYAVVVSNNSGSVTSAVATLTVRVRPVITAQPASRIVNPGDSVTFSVTATGTAPLGYQWRYNGGVISGATASSYVLNNAQPTNAGNYTVSVANTVGSTNSDVAVLMVRPRLISMSATNGASRFTLLGTPGLNYAIEASSYLTNWTTLTNMSNVAPQTPFTDPIPPGTSNRFYRVRLFP
jgi:hypothetical protein